MEDQALQVLAQGAEPVTGMVNILVVAPSWVGDAVMATPAIAALKETVAGARVTVLSKERTLDIFSSHPSVDGVEVFGPSLWAAARRLRRRGFHRAVVLPNSFRSAAAVFLAGIPERIGFSRDLRGPLLTHGLKVGPRLTSMHQADYYLELAFAAGASGRARTLSLGAAPESLNAAHRLLSTAGLVDGAPLVGLHTGATFGPAKRWPPERFAAAMNLLNSRRPINLIILGTGEESPEAERLLIMLDFPAIDLTGKTTLGQAMALISLVDLFISNDSGLMHVAAAYNRPQVALFGSTEPQKTAPLNERAVVIRKELSCSPCFKRECPLTATLCWDAIEVKEVTEAAIRLLAT